MSQFLRKFDLTLGPILTEGGQVMFMMFSALVLLICAIYQAQVIPIRYSMDYGEAPLVDQAMRLAQGENIYRADISTPPYTISNYPPLYVAAVSLAVRAFGPEQAFTAGRTLSALSAWIAALCIAFIIFKATKDRLAAYIAAVVFIAFPFVTFWSALLRIDLLALALSMAGLALLIAQPVSTPRFILSGLLLTAAIYTRQSYALAAPLAAFVWLIGPARNWKRGLVYAALVGGLSLALFLLLNALTGGGFFFNIVTANVNEFRLDILGHNWRSLLEAALLPLLVGGFSLFLLPRWQNPLWALAAPYLVGASLSALTIGKVGSNVNYLLELSAALALAAGVVVAWSRAQASAPHSLRALFLILLGLGLAQMMHVTLMQKMDILHDRTNNFTELNKLETLVKETPGDILADEYMGMLTLQGRSLYIQPFEVTQLARAGVWDQTPLLESIRNHEFAAVILYDQPWSNERWTPEMLDAIYSNYTLSGLISGNKVYTLVEQVEMETITACPGVTWQLPNDSATGVLWNMNGLNFYGWGQEGKVPVYAAADGLLTRHEDWFDTVAILSDDPLNPGQQVWSIYSNMGGSDGFTSFVAEDFPPGVTNVPVKAGQIVGYQGTWNGRPGWATWLHVLFVVLRADSAEFPAEVTPEMVLDPRTYLGIELPSQLELKVRTPVVCKQP
ncbi:MAG: ArnT family glycosyltransferase [Chloroflexota bacterium]